MKKIFRGISLSHRVSLLITIPKSYMSKRKSQINKFDKLLAFVIFILLFVSSCEVLKPPHFSGSIILQIQNTDSLGKESYCFYSLTMDSLSGNIIPKSIATPFPQATGQILSYSNDRNFIVFSDSENYGKAYKLLNLKSGKVNTIELLQTYSDMYFLFSPDSRWLAYTDFHRILVYDCYNNSKICLREPDSATYYGYNGYMYTFARIESWTKSNYLHFVFQSKMPETFHFDGGGNNYDPDTYMITSAQGQLITSGSIESLYSKEIPSTQKYLEETSLPKQVNVSNANISYSYQAPDDRHVIIEYIYGNSAPREWFWVDIESGKKTKLDMDLGLSYIESHNEFWSPDCSFFFYLHDEGLLGEYLHVIPVSGKESISFDLDRVTGMPGKYNKIVFKCSMNKTY
jgi:hypothetical protein